MEKIGKLDFTKSYDVCSVKNTLSKMKRHWELSMIDSAQS